MAAATLNINSNNNVIVTLSIGRNRAMWSVGYQLMSRPRYYTVNILARMDIRMINALSLKIM